ncbi:MAG: delta-60 repeat domain-containing protein [Saprospiraceae bacterium]|nr:delta-60 repeat domain-containing protein [Candidatus Vicinibacter affinis]
MAEFAVCWAQSLTIKYSKVGLRALIPVEFKNASGVDGSWIGVYRESDPDGNYISYQYINNLTSGELTFPGFKSSGVYNFRLYRDGVIIRLQQVLLFLVVEGMVIDNSFGDNGIFKWDASGAKLANGAKAVRLTKDGQLIIAGDVKNGKVSTNGAETVDFTVVKLGVDGLLDPSFGMNGKGCNFYKIIILPSFSDKPKSNGITGGWKNNSRGRFYSYIF